MDIAARYKRLNLSQRKLAELAKLDQNTVGRALKFKGDRAGGPFRSTMLALEMAIVGAERDMLHYLIGLHGCTVIEPVPAAELLAKAAPASGKAAA